jgi:hypothetical protein
LIFILEYNMKLVDINLVVVISAHVYNWKSVQFIYTYI